ncbi:MAG TPA: hypothetical protein VMJ75_28095 [Candidatus Acidoferrales bacterium]|nr:hypothetical protein [Candidatus Acidoferrales bacterium]
MRNRQIFLRYTLAGDSRTHVKSAYRIVIDGQGGLLLYRVESGRPERVCLDDLESFSIHTVGVPKRPARAVAA